MKLALCLAFWAVGGIGLMAQNPIIRNQFSADPSALVVGDKVYVFPSHDIPAPDDYGRKDWFCMADYHVFSSENLTDWTDHGKIVDQNEVEWVNSKSYSMWAPDCKPHNGKYYFYFPALMKVTEGMRFGGYRVGVATADKPEGPYTVMPKPIEGVGGIDPCIFVDDDGSGYLVWPSRGFVICKLNDDWTSLSDQRHTVEGVPTKGLTEGPYLFKRGEYYYMTFPWARENTEVLAYCMAKNIFGPYEFKGVFFEEHANGCWTNHHSIINFKDQWYIFYHCNHYSPSFDKNRAVCADSLFFNEDGTIKMVKPTLRGIGVAKADALLEIDRYSTISGDAYIDYHDTLNCFMGWKTIFPKKGGKVTFNTVDFSGKKKGYVQVRVRAPQGGTLAIGAPKVFATVQVPQTQDWKVVTAKVSKFPKGIQNLEVTLTGGSDVEVDWVTFNNPPFSEGGMKTGKYRNYFAEMGFSQKEIDAKLKSVFNDVFYGPHKCYFEVGDSLGYISDVKNHDVRTEGMSYGMMIAVQFGNKDIFDRLWRWSKKYMQMTEGPGKGYFAWSVKPDGSNPARGAAADGAAGRAHNKTHGSGRYPPHVCRGEDQHCNAEGCKRSLEGKAEALLLHYLSVEEEHQGHGCEGGGVHDGSLPAVEAHGAACQNVLAGQEHLQTEEEYGENAEPGQEVPVGGGETDALLDGNLFLVAAGGVGVLLLRAGHGGVFLELEEGYEQSQCKGRAGEAYELDVHAHADEHGDEGVGQGVLDGVDEGLPVGEIEPVRIVLGHLGIGAVVGNHGEGVSRVEHQKQQTAVNAVGGAVLLKAHGEAEQDV